MRTILTLSENWCPKRTCWSYSQGKDSLPSEVTLTRAGILRHRSPRSGPCDWLMTTLGRVRINSTRHDNIQALNLANSTRWRNYVHGLRWVVPRIVD
jgi:hypothetical protein